MSGRRPVELQDAPRPLRAAVDWGRKPGAVKYVVDGDTVGVLLDWGGAHYAFETIRLFDLWAPEKRTPEGREAAAVLSELLPVDEPVVVIPYELDAYGRVVADILCSPGRQDVESVVSIMRARGFDAPWIEEERS